MSLENYWKKALSETEVIRSRVQSLSSFEATKVPYIFLAESSINIGDTVVRKGELLVERPSLIVPPNNPQFNGFDFQETTGVDSDSFINFLLIRGVSLPSLKYDNQVSSLDVYEGSLSEAIKHYENDLQRTENVSTGLIKGPEDVWQFSLLIFIGSQIIKNAEMDFKSLLRKFDQD